MDELSFALAIQLQLSDVEEALSSRKGKGRLGDAVSSSDEVAFNDYREHLLATARMFADERLAESLDRAVRSDGGLLEELTKLELGDEGSRQLAMQLSEEPMTDEAIAELERRCQEWDLVDELEQKVDIPLSRCPSYSGSSNPKSGAKTPRSGTAHSGTTYSGANTYKPGLQKSCANCAICLESFSAEHTITAPCTHSYCFTDLKDLFVRACKDEQLFPPRCCKKELSIELVLPLLTDNQVVEFLEKSEEYTCKDRTYCFQPSCSRFIPAQNISRDVATCMDCYSLTCKLCKKEEHDSEDCPEDPSMMLTLETAAAKGWQRCQQCHSLVERSHGCQHMTCRCKAEWCYRCGVKWKTCECGDWDEDHLHRRAEDLAIREVGASAGSRALAMAARTIVQDLRSSYECEHTEGWTYTRTGASCEMCSDYLPSYIYVCDGCRLRACNRCHINRI
ncbi:hypothetical protein DFP73DRAFT_484934 [Morchella snyderi]|nr:hypothetical protein DFP73DRAFT_484934 [Morchella snyderi]